MSFYSSAMSRRAVTTVAAILICAFFADASHGQTGPTRAQLFMRLKGASNSSIVSFELGGFGIADTSLNLFPDIFTSGITGVAFDITNGFNPFPPANPVNVGTFALRTGSATWANTTTGQTLVIDEILLQDSSFLDLVDRFGVGTVGGYSLSDGDEFVWSGSGTIDLSDRGLDFDDLVLGAGFGTANILGASLGIDATLFIVAVPEPLTGMLLIAGCLLCPLRQGRDH